MWWLQGGSSAVSLCTGHVRVVQPDRWWMGKRSCVSGWALWPDIPRWLHTYPKFWELRCLLISLCPKVSDRSPFWRLLLGRGQFTVQSKHLKFGGLETKVNLEAARGFSLWRPFCWERRESNHMQGSTVWPCLCEELISYPALGVLQGNRCYQQLGSLSFSRLTYSLKYMFIGNCSKMISPTSLSCMYSVCFCTVQFIYKTRSWKQNFEMCSKYHKVFAGTVFQGKIEGTRLRELIGCVYGSR